MKYVWIDIERTYILMYCLLIFVAIFLRYECLKSDKHFKIVKNVQKWLINARNVTLKPGTNFNLVLICSLFLQLLEKFKIH